MENNCLKIGKIIKKKRIEKGFSTRSLGELIGISNAEVSRIENGLKKDIGLITFLNICNVLDIDVEELLANANLSLIGEYKLYYVLFKSKEEKIYKVHARSHEEAMGLAFDFVMNNELIKIEKSCGGMVILVEENIEDFDRDALDYFEKYGELPFEDGEEIF